MTSVDTGAPTPGGSLTVVGTGIELGGHLTAAARSHIEQADKVFYLTDISNGEAVTSLNPSAESLHGYYGLSKLRIITYLEIVGRVLREVRTGANVCFVTYGHPGVYAFPPHEAIRRARKEGYRARMLPAVSAEDCLFADLGVDPASCGSVNYDATYFLTTARPIDPTVALILWQIGVIGVIDLQTSTSVAGVRVLSEVLAAAYGPDHEVVVYEAAQFALCSFRAETVPLVRLDRVAITAASTLYVPPLRAAAVDPAMVARLNIRLDDIQAAVDERFKPRPSSGT